MIFRHRNKKWSRNWSPEWYHSNTILKHKNFDKIRYELEKNIRT